MSSVSCRVSARWVVRHGVSALLLLAGWVAVPQTSAQTARFSGSVVTLGGGFTDPWGIAVDRSGNIYVGDNVGTVGSTGGSVKEIPAGCTAARYAAGGCSVTALTPVAYSPNGVALDTGGNVYFTDGSAIYRIPAGCTAAGIGAGTCSLKSLGAGGVSNAHTVAVDASGNVYFGAIIPRAPLYEIPASCISGANNSTCVQALPVNATTSSDTISTGYGLAVGTNGNLYFSNSLLSDVTEAAPTCASSSCVTTLGGSGYVQPTGVAVDAGGNVYFAVDSTDTVDEIPATCISGGNDSSCVTTLAGGLNFPEGVAVDTSGNVYVADSSNNAIKEIMLNSVNFFTEPVGSTTAADTLTFAFETSGTLGAPAVLTMGAPNLDFAIAPGGTCASGTAYMAGQTCTVNVTFSPKFPGLRIGAVQLMTTSGAVIATADIYGTGDGPQVVFPGNRVAAAVGSGFSSPYSVAVDGSGDVFVADFGSGAVKEIVAVNGQVSASSTVRTVASGFAFPDGVAVDGSGNVFVADGGAQGGTTNSGAGVYEFAAVNGQIPANPTKLTLGSGFDSPSGVTVDGSDDVFVSDSGYAGFNEGVYEIVAVNGQVSSASTVESLGGGFLDPSGVAVDGSGDVFVADTYNDAAKEIPASCISGANNSSCVTAVGNGFSKPDGVAVDAAGDVFVAANGNGVVYEVAAVNGQVSSSSTVLSVASGFNLLNGMTVGGSGNVFIANTGNRIVDELPLATPPSLSFPVTAAGSQSATQTVTVANSGNATLDLETPTTAGAYNPSISADFTYGNSSTCTQVGASMSPFQLASAATCTLQITFEPTTGGAISGSVVLTDDTLNATAPAYATQTIPLSGSASQIAPTVTVSPASVSYGVASVSLSASVSYAASAPTGAFTFRVGTGGVVTATCVGSSSPLICTASYPTSTLAVGSDTITGTLAADATYTTASNTATLTVGQGIPTISTPPTATSITYGQTLAASTLAGGAASYNGTTVAGTFSFSAPTTAPAAGTASFSVTFTPTNATDYNTATATVSVTIAKATPTITTAPTASAITYGQTLAASTLTGGAASYNGTAVAGTFSFSAPTTAPAAGTASYPVIFTPTNATDYNTATATVSVVTNQATQSIVFTLPTTSLTYGSASTIGLSATGGASGNPVTYAVISGPGSVAGSVLSILGAGTIRVTATELGNANYTAASPVTQTLVVNPASVTLTGPAAPVVALYGQSATIPVAVRGQFNGTDITPPTGSLSYSLLNASGANVASGTATIANGSASIPVPATLMPGNYSVSVTFPGSTDYAASTAALGVVLQVGQIQPVATIAAPGAALTYGAPLGIRATATYNGSAVAGSFSYSAALAGGTPSAVTAATVLPAGSYSLTANFTPTNATDYKTATATAMLTVNKATPGITLTSTVNPVVLKNATSFVAVVSFPSGVPTGTVTFLDNGTIPLGTANLLSGSATLSINTLGPGANQITAVYSGDANFIPVTSTSLTEQVDGLSLTISTSGGTASQTSQIVEPGSTARFDFIVSPIGSTTLPSLVTLSVSGLPPGATDTFTPTKIAAGSGAAPVTLSITLPSQTAAMYESGKLGSIAFAFLLLPFAGSFRRRARKLSRMVAVLLLLIGGVAATLGVTGCGSSNGFFSQPQKAYNVTVTATSGALTNSTNITLTVE